MDPEAHIDAKRRCRFCTLGRTYLVASVMGMTCG
jgi:hypothetical protein